MRYTYGVILGYTATVFGATGFLGRYIVNRLGLYHGPAFPEAIGALTSRSNPGMHCGGPLPRGDDQAPLEGHR